LIVLGNRSIGRWGEVAMDGRPGKGWRDGGGTDGASHALTEK